MNRVAPPPPPPPLPLMAQQPIARIVERHADEAPYLWRQRQNAVGSPRYDLASLASLDERLDAHVAGLVVAGGAAHDALVGAAEVEPAGAVFALVLHGASGDACADSWQAALALGAKDAAGARGLASALGWMSPAVAAPRIRTLTAAESPHLRRAAVAAVAMHPGLGSNTGGADPAAVVDTRLALEVALADVQPIVVRRALRATGELGRVALLERVLAGARLDDAETAFWAARSACLLGAAASAGRLLDLADTGGPRATDALTMALLTMRTDKGERALAAAFAKKATERVAVAAAPAVGTPAAVQLLLDRMEEPALARLAGASFAIITGADLSVEKLEGAAPADFEAGPNDDPEDENVDVDPDEGLPWPDVAAVRRWWDKQGSKRLDRAERHIAGKPADAASLDHVLATGKQPARMLAALALALRRAGEVTFDVRAPARRQRAALAAAAAT